MRLGTCESQDIKCETVSISSGTHLVLKSRWREARDKSAERWEREKRQRRCERSSLRQALLILLLWGTSEGAMHFKLDDGANGREKKGHIEATCA